MIKVVGWFMTDHPHNVTTDAHIVATWNRQLFRVSPLYHIDTITKQCILNILEDCYLQVDDGAGTVCISSSIIDILYPLANQ